MISIITYCSPTKGSYDLGISTKKEPPGSDPGGYVYLACIR
jgi:hypothetical protein